MTLIDKINNLLRLSKKESSQPAQDGHSVPDVKIRIGRCTEIGYFRDNNEDRVYVDPDWHLYIVADGMGGQAAGEQASQLAVERLPFELQSVPLQSDDPTEIRQALFDAFVLTNEAIMARGLADPSTQNMGTTALLAMYRANTLYLAHIGDSRAYMIRDNTIESLTIDHNLAQALFMANSITKEELKTHRFKNVLWKYLGSKEALEGPDITGIEVRPGDKFLLATDGLSGVLDDEDILKEVERFDDPQKFASYLVKMSLEAGSKDNVSVVVLYVDEV